jgi:hypothetical protein
MDILLLISHHHLIGSGLIQQRQQLSERRFRAYARLGGRCHCDAPLGAPNQFLRCSCSRKEPPRLPQAPHVEPSEAGPPTMTG